MNDTPSSNAYVPPPAPPNALGSSADHNVYGNAEPQPQLQASAPYAPDEEQKQMATTPGAAVMAHATDQMQSDYTESAQAQANQHQAPPPPMCCIKLLIWFPIRHFAFGSGVFLFVASIIDLLSRKPSFIQIFLYFYLMAFAIVTISVEWPSWKMTRALQLHIFSWCRLMSKMWGRAWFYLSVAILCFAGTKDRALFTVIAGAVLVMVSVSSFIFSWMASHFARKIDANGAEGDQMIDRFMRKFDELDNAGRRSGNVKATEPTDDYVLMENR